MEDYPHQKQIIAFYTEIYLKEKKKLEDIIENYKRALAFKIKQEKEFMEMFPDIRIYNDINEEIRLYSTKLTRYISEMPIEPGKFLRLPDDCYYEIAKYFIDLDEFITFLLISKKIKLNGFIFKNVKLYRIIIQSEDYQLIGNGKCELNHGKINLTEFNSIDNHLNALNNVIYIDCEPLCKRIYLEISIILKNIKYFHKPKLQILDCCPEPLNYYNITNISKYIKDYKLDFDNIYINRHAFIYTIICKNTFDKDNFININNIN